MASVTSLPTRPHEVPSAESTSAPALCTYGYQSHQAKSAAEVRAAHP